MSYIRSPLHPDLLLPLLPLLDGEQRLVPGSDELAVVIPEIPAHFERGQRGEQSPPVEAVLAATLLPLRGHPDVTSTHKGQG